VTDAFFTPDGEWLVASELTRGPWDPGSQHAGPPSALVARAIERAGDADGFQVGRITLEIMRPVPIGRLRATARVVRPGRSVQLIEATLEGEEGELIRALAWRLRTQPVELSPKPPEEPPPPGPEEGEAKGFFDTGQAVGYHTAMEYRFVKGGFLEAGPAMVWMRQRQPLVAGEETTPLQRLMVVADSGNGVSAALDVGRFIFINTDLSVHLMRMPEGEWICLDAVTYPQENGIGLADTALYDERGRIGRAAQTLLVRAR
jgi:hypothetical protein